MGLGSGDHLPYGYPFVWCGCRFPHGALGNDGRESSAECLEVGGLRRKGVSLGRWGWWQKSRYILKNQVPLAHANSTLS